jgi:hypothetical protein
VGGSTSRFFPLRAFRLAFISRLVSPSFRLLTRGILVPLGATLMFFFAVVAAPAYAGVPTWAVSSASSPTNFAAGDETGDDMYVLRVVDAGGGSMAGSPIEVTDALPSGLVASSITGEDLGNGEALSCSLTPTLGCSYEGFEVAPGDVLQIEIRVKVGSGAGPSVVNSATVTGGGAGAGASIEDPTTISSAAAGFGISGFAATWSGTQAGASVNLTTGFTLNQVVSKGETRPAAEAKEVMLNLPPGFVANPEAVPQCSVSDAEVDTCPAVAAVGVAFTSSSSEVGGAPAPYSSLVYNTVPSVGEPGALVMFLPSGPMWLGIDIRSDGDYGLRVQARDLSPVDALIAMTLTLWGVPGAHNGFGPGPDHVLAGSGPSFGSAGGLITRFTTSAGACGGASPSSTLSADSWAAPGVFAEASSTSPELTGCNKLSFDPSISVVPSTSEGGEPSGYELDLQIPQTEDPEGLASAEPREAAVTLPEGTGISLPAADGLQACSQAQVGLGSAAAVTCPEASKIGNVMVTTPLLVNPLQGAVYLATPNENPFGSLLAMYIVAEEPVSGVQVKLAGRVDANQATGQLTLVLGELPQLPVSRVDLQLFGGARALLSTPVSCGPATSTSELTPWSGTAGVTPFSSFEVTSGANGTPCSNLRPFSPAFQTGATNDAAGSYNSLTFLLTRADQEEDMSKIALQVPQAVQEMFTGVTPCGEPLASDGECPASSEVGSVALAVGSGPDPYDLNGNVYLTGPYRGTSQGLSIVVPFSAGPFELGTVVIRASAQIDPGTGQMTIATDALPSVIDGIPIPIKDLALQLDRGEFELNPNNCEPPTVTGTITSTQGSTVVTSTDPLGTSSTQCNPPQADAPAATPQASGVPSGAATVSLTGTTHITTTSRGEATIKLTCTGTGTCRGKLTLTVKRKGRGIKRSKTTTIATATFSIPPGKTTAIKLRINPTGRALLSANHGPLSAILTVLKLSSATSQTHSETVRLVLQKSYDRTKK